MAKKIEKWIWEWERQAHPVIIYQLAKVYSQDKTWPWLRVPVLFISFKQVVKLYFSSSILAISHKLSQKIQKDKNFLKKYKTLMSWKKRQLTDFCKELDTYNFKKLSSENLIKLLEKYGKLYRQHGVMPIRILNKKGPEIVENFLLKKYNKKQVEKWLPILFMPLRESIEKRSEKDLLKVAKQISLKKKKNKEKLIKNYLKKYQWIPCGYADESPFSEKDIWQKISSLLRTKNFGQEQISITKRINLLKILKLPQNIRNLVDVLSEFTFYKDFIRMNYNQFHFYAKPLFEESGKRLGLKISDIRYLSIPEIIDSLKTGRVNKNSIKARKDNYVCYTKGQKIYLEAGKKAKLKQKEIVRAHKQNTQLIVGLVASLGKRKGVVKIIRNIKEAKEFPKNGILVTPMTTPELVAVVKKSIAIVTDEGGVTCHAAIISRELKIPCIIGTKIATQVLKDGDRVEVDANKGIVRKL